MEVPHLWLLCGRGKDPMRFEPGAGGGGVPRAVRLLLLQGSLPSEPRGNASQAAADG